MKTTTKALQGDRTIKMVVYFFSDELAKDGYVRPKHAHSGGMVYLEKNPSHGITKRSAGFQSVAQIPAAIEKLLIRGGITLHATPTMRYLATK